MKRWLQLPEMFEALNLAEYFYLRELSEPRDNSLRLVVEETVSNQAGTPSSHPELPELEAVLKVAWPIESVEGCRTFELLWERYVAYLVTEELVGSCGKREDAKFTGNLFREYTQSHFLSHLARDTGGHVEPIRHYKLICLNHLIDIASYSPPEIRLLSPCAIQPQSVQ